MREYILTAMLLVGSFAVAYGIFILLYRIKKIRSIFTGWKNVVLRDELAEKIARERAVFCAVCPHAVPSKFGTSDDIKSISGKICNKCGCNLSAKLRSPMEECPIGKWDEEI